MNQQRRVNRQVSTGRPSTSVSTGVCLRRLNQQLLPPGRPLDFYRPASMLRVAAGERMQIPYASMLIPGPRFRESPNNSLFQSPYCSAIFSADGRISERVAQNSIQRVWGIKVARAYWRNKLWLSGGSPICDHLHFSNH